MLIQRNGYFPPPIQDSRQSQKTRILVLGNYFPDQQESMNRYAALLQRIYSCVGSVTLVSPPNLVARLPYLPPIVRKYISYIDKFVLFPVWLSFRSSAFDLVHIADHSNSLYSFFCQRTFTITTCHDLLAVRGALGDLSVACDPSPVGIFLQRMIMAGLRHSDALVFPSHSTFKDFQRLMPLSKRQRYAVIPNPPNANFTRDPDVFPVPPDEQALVPKHPYLLMVGSSLPRKNRALALQLLVLLGADSPYSLVFAGDPLTPDEYSFRAKHSLGSRLISIIRPSHALLNFLYCHAHALIFPSLSEGFGWPVLEAQICSCPVISSNTTSMPEVAGQGALYADPMDPAMFLTHVRTLEDASHRQRLIELGLENIHRFAPDVIADDYHRFAFQP
jgi:glycosyltransferase involved in cell wall biosynthesis